MSTKQAKACRRNGLEAYLKDWRELTPDTLGIFDSIVSVGSFEHFCSVAEYTDGKQEQIYRDFFKLCHRLLKPGGRVYLQTMVWGRNAPAYAGISLDSPKGSDSYILALLGKFYPGSWLPDGIDQIVQCAEPHFRLVSANNGRRDYIETMERWSIFKTFSLPKAWAALKLLHYFVVDRDFRYKIESLRRGCNKECLKREIIDHQRIIFTKL